MTFSPLRTGNAVVDRNLDQIATAIRSTTATVVSTTTTASTASASYGPFSGLPPAGTSGRIYVASDSPVAIWVDDGAAWHPLVLGQVSGAAPPAASGFTGYNSAGASISDRNGALYIAGPDDGASENTLRAFVKTISTLASSSIEAALAHSNDWQTGVTEQWPVVGLAYIENATGKAVTIGITPFATGGPSTGGAFCLEVINWTSTTTRGATDNTYEVVPVNQPLFLRLMSNGTSVFAEWSSDRQNWNTLATLAIAGNFTSAPDRFGPYVQGRGNTPKANILSYSTQG